MATRTGEFIEPRGASDARGGATSPAIPFSHVHAFSTDMLPRRERFDAFCEGVARNVFRIDVRCDDADKFRSSFRTVRMDGVTVLKGKYTPASFGRTRELISDGNDDFLFQISSSSTFQAEQLDRKIGKGEGLLGDNSRVGRITCALPGAITTVSLPRKTLMGFVPGAEDLVRMRTVGGEQLEMKLLRAYLATIYETPDIDAPRLKMAGAHIVDLLAMALGAKGEAAVEAQKGGLRAARSVAVRNSVMARLRDPALAPSDIARVNGVSERYLRQIFEDMGSGFSDFLVAHRLEKAHELLLDATRRHSLIATIAYEVGFSDLSHFNRRFRRRYGCTPSELRAGQ